MPSNDEIREKATTEARTWFSAHRLVEESRRPAMRTAPLGQPDMAQACENVARWARDQMMPVWHGLEDDPQDFGDLRNIMAFRADHLVEIASDRYQPGIHGPWRERISGVDYPDWPIESSHDDDSSQSEREGEGGGS